MIASKLHIKRRQLKLGKAGHNLYPINWTIKEYIILSIFDYLGQIQAIGYSRY